MTKSLRAHALLPLVVLLCVPHAQLEARHHKDSNVGGWLVGAGCALVGGLIGVAAYNACQDPSDSEELSSGHYLLNDAHSLQAKYAARYQRDCSCSSSIEQLKHSIFLSGPHTTPLVHYASKLNSDICRVHSMIGDLISKKNHLFERKMELPHDSDKMSREERRAYAEQYDNLIEQISAQIDTLQAMCNDLRHLEATIVGLPEYREEQLVSHINHLENKIDRMNHSKQQVYVCQQPAFAPCWYEPVSCCEPTVVLHSNINIVDSEPAPRPCSSSWGWGVEYNYHS